MSESTSNFNIMKLVSSGLTGGITAIVEDGSEWVLGRALTAMGHPQGENKTDELLSDINAELGVIGNTIAEVLADVQQIQTQLNVNTQQILNSVGISTIIPSLSAIEYGMTSLCSMSDNTGQANCGTKFSIFSSSNSVTCDSTPSVWSPPSSDSLMSWSEEILNVTSGIGPDMTTIKNTLLDSNSAPGLINGLTDYAIEQMSQGVGTTYDWYLWLESAVMQIVVDFNNGMILMSNATAYLNDPDPSSTSQNALNWVNDTYKPWITDIMNEFMSAAERMALSNYDPTAIEANPQFLSDSNLNQIFSRFDLLYWLTLSTTSTPTSPGIIARQYIRPSQLTPSLSSATGGPSLNPGSDYSASNGTLAGVPSLYSGQVGSKMPYWYKCLDFSDYPNNVQMISFDDSDIRIARYHWNFPSNPPTDGTPIASSGFFNEVVAAYYDTSTLELATSETTEKVLFAPGTTGSAITENQFFTNYENSGGVPAAQSDSGTIFPWETVSEFDPDNNQDHAELFPDLSCTADCSKVPHVCQSSVSIPDCHGITSGAGSAKHHFMLKRNVCYPGSSNQNIVAFINGSGTVSIDGNRTTSTGTGEGATIAYYPPASMEMECKQRYFSGSSNDSFEGESGSFTPFFDKANIVNNNSSVSFDKKMNTDLQAGVYNSFEFRIYITAERQHTGTNDYLKGSTTPVSGSFSIDFMGLAYTQPTITS